MKCIICGRELVGKQVKYCRLKCANIGYRLGYNDSKENKSKTVENLYKRFKKAFDVDRERYNPKRVWLIRVFIKACLIKGYTQSSIARGIHKDHSCVHYHTKRIQKNEEKLAVEFLKNENYHYVKTNYPKGFTYGAKK